MRPLPSWPHYSSLCLSDICILVTVDKWKHNDILQEWQQERHQQLQTQRALDDTAVTVMPTFL